MERLARLGMARMWRKAFQVIEDGPMYFASRENVWMLQKGGRKKYGAVESRKI